MCNSIKLGLFLKVSLRLIFTHLIMAFYSNWASSKVSFVTQTCFYSVFLSEEAETHLKLVAYVLGGDDSLVLEVIKIPTNHHMFMQSITITNTLNQD